jgi:hypothetical protein
MYAILFAWNIRALDAIKNLTDNSKQDVRVGKNFVLGFARMPIKKKWLKYMQTKSNSRAKNNVNSVENIYYLISFHLQNKAKLDTLPIVDLVPEKKCALLIKKGQIKEKFTVGQPILSALTICHKMNTINYLNSKTEVVLYVLHLIISILTIVIRLVMYEVYCVINATRGWDSSKIITNFFPTPLNTSLRNNRWW